MPNAHKDWYNFVNTEHAKQGISPEYNTIKLIYIISLKIHKPIWGLNFNCVSNCVTGN